MTHPERIQGVMRLLIVYAVTKYLFAPLAKDWPEWVLMVAFVPYVIIALEFVFQPRREHAQKVT
jgi:hypothetical protein